MSKPPEECQFHNNCGGWCETEEEKEHNLCEHCLEADREREEESRMDSERRNALQRIAVAAGIELALPNEIADIVCAKLSLANTVMSQPETDTETKSQARPGLAR